MIAAIFRMGVVSMVGQMLIGRFRIIKSLGAGAFGETFLAEDTHNKIKPQCVIKRLIVQSNPVVFIKIQKLFDLEAGKLHQLDHQGIPKLIAHFENGGQFYLVQDFVDGHTLKQEINPSTKWTEAKVRGFLCEALEILAYVHDQGSIHRDLKPENMMRRQVNDKLVLIDFGAVREVRQTPSNLAIGLASFGTTVIGTLGYMPAEQANGIPCYASDVYAMGCIAIQALIGEYPHNFEKDVNTGEIRWRQRVRVSDEFAAIIDKMVRYDWRQRYKNAGEALAALQPAPVIPKSAPSVIKTIPMKPPITQPNHTRRNFLALAGASTLSIVAWEYFRPKGKEPSISTKPTASPTASSPAASQPKPPEVTSTPEPTSPPINRLQTQTLNNIITVDSYGRETNRRSVQIQYFVEDRVNLPNGAKEIAMALIPAGKFDMGRPNSEKGDSDELPQHQVKFPNDFYMSRYAVTQAQWLAVMGKFTDEFNKSTDAKFKGDNRPMIYVSWHEAREFCKKLTSLNTTRGIYRLPTEAEWEYACRAGTTTLFHFGETITSDRPNPLVNYNGEYPYANAPKGLYRQVTTDVGSFPANAWGLHDMHGNVWEWCLDEYHDNYSNKPESLKNNGSEAWGDLNINENDNRSRLLRGGSWYRNAVYCRSSYRSRYYARDRIDFIGFWVILASSS